MKTQSWRHKCWGFSELLRLLAMAARDQGLAPAEAKDRLGLGVRHLHALTVSGIGLDEDLGPLGMHLAPKWQQGSTGMVLKVDCPAALVAMAKVHRHSAQVVISVLKRLAKGPQLRALAVRLEGAGKTAI